MEMETLFVKAGVRCVNLSLLDSTVLTQVTISNNSCIDFRDVSDFVHTLIITGQALPGGGILVRQLGNTAQVK